MLDEEVVMPKGILSGETRPLPGREEEYHKWYDETHVPEIVAFDGFVSARRFAPVDEGSPFIAIYEMDADDLDAAQSRVIAASRAGTTSSPEFVQFDPPPTVRVLREISAYAPASPLSKES
jgi:hypothetical protein